MYFKTYFNISDMICMELEPQFLSLTVTWMVHSMTHLGKPSDRPLRKIYMRCELMKLYSLTWIVSLDRDGIGPRHIGTVKRWIQSEEDFPASMRIYLQKRGIARARGSTSVKPFHEWLTGGSISGTFIRLRIRLPRNRKCTYIEWRHLKIDNRFFWVRNLCIVFAVLR
jgi:hypothetical protein